MPRILAHISLTQNTIFEGANEVAIALVATSTAAASPLVVSIDIPVSGRRIVCRAGLQPDRGVGVKVARHALNRRGNPSFSHGRRALTASSCRCLCIEALRRGVLGLRRHLSRHHIHLVAIARWLRRVRRWCALLIHAVVHRGRLSMCRSVVLVHLHVVRRLRMCCLCCSLLTGSLGLLLLLYARCDSFVERCVLQVHRWYKRTSELLLGDERVQLGLLRGPSLKRVDRQQATHEVNECDPVVQLYMDWSESLPVDLEDITLTSLDFCLLHTLAWHRVTAYNLLQSRRGEVLLAWLLLCVVLSRVLLQALQTICLPSVLVLSLLEELARLLAHFQHPCRRKAEHFHNPADLIIFGGTGEEGQAQEELDDNATE